MDGRELGGGAEARELGLALAPDRRRSRYEGGKCEGGVKVETQVQEWGWIVEWLGFLIDIMDTMFDQG